MVNSLSDLTSSVPNRFDKSYMAPGFFGQTWGSWFLFVIVLVSAFFLALSLNRVLRRAL